MSGTKVIKYNTRIGPLPMCITTRGGPGAGGVLRVLTA
jgi:hypothetical protein